MSIDPFVPATLHASSEPSSEDPRRVLAFCIWARPRDQSRPNAHSSPFLRSRKWLVSTPQLAYCSPMLEETGLTRAVLDRARRSRDARFDGKFFIAVTSTRIYCRPICPAKTSKDENVTYYATAAEAAAAGFRPCRRCRPESAPGSPAWLGTSAVVRRALRMIQGGALDEGSVEQLASRLGVGVRHLCRLFTRHLGTSPTAIAQTRRLHFAKQLLDETDLPITEIALASGFGSVRRFNDAFNAMYRRPPRELRKRLRADRRRSVDAQIKLQLSYRPPYDWHTLVRFLARHAIPGVEAVSGETYLRTVPAGSGRHAILQVRPVTGVNALELCVRGAEPADLLPLTSSVRRMFDLSADPERIALILKRDARLAPLVTARPGLRIPGTWSPFESGVRAIIGQKLLLEEARPLLARLVECAGEQFTEGERLRYLFPTPDAVAKAHLEDLGLAPGRAQALRRFAFAVRDGAITLDEPEAQLLRLLTDITGIDTWVVGYVVLRGLGEPDGFPSGDPLLRRQLSGHHTLLSAEELDSRAELWRPFRGYAVLHLWQAAAADSFEVRTQPVHAHPAR